MIDLRRVTIRKSGKALFENLDLTLNTHEHWVIRGANGSGKTLLLETIAGYHTLSGGEITYDFLTDKSFEDFFTERHKRVALIGTHALQKFISSFHNLFYQQRYYSLSGNEHPTVREILGEKVYMPEFMNFPSQFKVQEFLDVEVTKLSNGQLKKVLILNRLLQNKPDVILLDYPFDGLDIESRQNFVSFLDHIARVVGVQLVIADNHHELPDVIEHEVVLENLSVKSQGRIKERSFPGRAAEKVQVSFTHQLENHPVVEMKDVTIRYGDRTIIKDLNWTINRGEKWALTGRNGSGKTTLFSLIFADHPMAYSEKVFLFGKRRGSGESIWDIKGRINYLGPEQIHFLDTKFSAMTGREYLNRNFTTDTKHLENLIQFFQAGDFVNEHLYSFSSGQLQVLMLIKCFIERKELLLLDEPYQFLDAANRLLLQQYLNSYLSPEITMVMITHDPEDLRLWTQKRLEL